MICDASPPMRIHYGRAGLPAATLKRLTALYRELGSHYKVADAIGRTPQATWQVLRRIGVITPKKRLRGVTYKGEKFTPDKDGFMRSTSFASRRKGCNRLLHRLVWEERHGPISKKQRKTHMFLFQDGNRSNCALSNLIFVSRKEAAKYRAWNGNGWTKWNERHTKLVQALKRLEATEADPAEIETARQALASLPPWKGNGDPEKRRRKMLRRWAKKTPEQRAAHSAKVWATRRANRTRKYGELPAHGIAMLSEREREILHRHFVLGESCDELGAALQINRATVSLIVLRALKRIPENARVAEERVESVRRFVFSRARVFAGRNRGVDIEDLAQVGLQSVLKAATRFDPTRGIKFLTYCARGIDWQMRRYVTDHSQQVRVPANKFYEHRLSLVSLDAPLESEDGTYDSVGDRFCGTEASAPDELDFTDRVGLLTELLARLSSYHQRILRALYFDNKTQEEVSHEFGITRGAIFMAKQAALKRLRKMPELLRKFTITEVAA